MARPDLAPLAVEPTNDAAPPAAVAGGAYLDGWRARRLREQAVDAAWRHDRRAEAERAAEALALLPGVRRVVLFGSLARDEATRASDVDLCVEGLGEEQWLDAIAAARRCIAHAEVDLVRAEAASPSLLARVAAEGLVLRGR